MANGAEVARAFVTIVPTMQGAQAEITKELTGITDQAAKEAGSSGGSNFGGSFSDALKGTAAVITGTLVAVTTAAVAAATSAGKAFINAAKDTAAYGDEVDKTSQRLGVSRQAYQELDYVLNLAGTSMSNSAAGFRTLTNQIDDAVNGSVEAQGRFEALGISLEDLSSMSREDVFLAVVNGFQNMGDTAERAALANDIFGRSGQQLAPLFNMTAEATRGAIATANEYGMVLSDEGVAASAQFTDSMTTMERTTQGLKNQMMANFLPAMSSIMDGISQIFSGDKAGSALIKDGITELIGKVQTYAPIFFDLAESIVNALLDSFTPMLPDAVTAIFSFLNTAILKISGMIPQLTPVISTGLKSIMQAVFQSLPVIISSLLELIQDIVTWLGNGETVKILITGILQLVSIIADSLAEALPVLLPAIVNIIGQIAEAITEPANVEMILESVLYIIGAILFALVEALPEIGYLVTETFLNLVDLLADFWEWIIPPIQDGINNIVNKVKEFGTNVKNFFTSIGTTIKTKVVGWVNSVRELISSWITTIKTNISNFFTNLKESVSNVFTTIGNTISSIKEKVGKLVSAVFDTIKELPTKVISIGKNLVEGLWNGISDKIEWVKKKIKSMGSTITNAIKSVFGIASPSKIWKKEIGVNLALGLGEGFTDEMASVKDEMVDSMDDLTYSMNSEVKAVGVGDSSIVPGSSYTGGSVTINVYGAEGQDVNSLAEIIAQKLGDMTRRKELAYA